MKDNIDVAKEVIEIFFGKQTHYGYGMLLAAGFNTEVDADLLTAAILLKHKDNIPINSMIKHVFGPDVADLTLNSHSKSIFTNEYEVAIVCSKIFSDLIDLGVKYGPVNNLPEEIISKYYDEATFYIGVASEFVLSMIGRKINNRRYTPPVDRCFMMINEQIHSLRDKFGFKGLVE